MIKLITWIFFCLLNVPTLGFSTEDQPLYMDDPKWAWMDQQIALDFLPFEKEGISEAMVDRAFRRAFAFPHVARLQIIGGKVYGGGGGEADRLLTKITQLYPVPDVDIVVYGQDLIHDHWNVPGPILVTCKLQGGSTSSHQILFPSQLWETWIHFAQEVESACEHSPWEEKIAKYFWRGKPNDASNYQDRSMWTKYRRGKFCYLSQLHPELIDATFSSYWDSTLGGLVDEFFKFFPKKTASWDEYIHHKYLIDLDGYVACTPGYAWRLLTNCTVFKQESPYYLWFSGALRPWVHYVPIKEDLSDVFEKLEWAKTQDLRAELIANNGRQFAKNNIMPEHLYLYCYKVLLKYASLQRFSPKKK